MSTPDHPESQFEARFGLKHTPTGKVAEISKATAESDCPPKERINLHIGNPVQHIRLDERYAELVFGNALKQFKGLIWSERQQRLIETQTSPVRGKLLKLIFDTIEKANPYMPQGGYTPQKPGTLIKQVHAWLTQSQDESLEYSIGAEADRPEVAITSGGRTEALKLLLQVIEENLKSPDKNLVSLEIPLSACTTRTYSGNITLLEGTETDLLKQLDLLVSNPQTHIGFVLLHKIYSKEFRRECGALAVRKNLMLVEANDAANFYSLARSPGMAQRLLRVVTPQAIDKRLGNSSITFVLGNALYIEALNLLHFLKKGTPSATEVKLLSFLLNDRGCLDEPLWRDLTAQHGAAYSKPPEFENALRIPGQRHPGVPDFERITHALSGLSSRTGENITRLARSAENLGGDFARRAEVISRKIFKDIHTDFFGGKSSWEVIENFFLNLNSVPFLKQLEEAFLAQFTKVHPEFDPSNTISLSGSARTALSSAAEAWHLREAIIPDLSWTIGDAIPNVTAVPLNDDLSICADGIIQTISAKIDSDPDWLNTGCVVLNNPHNATGKITPEAEIEKILVFCLSRGITVIDDLSYSNVIIADRSERNKRFPVKNCRQLTNQLIARGYLPRDAFRTLITIRSISKTDCKAGARLCVVEIPDRAMREDFLKITAEIEPNRMALLLSYLFYRNGLDLLEAFWAERDQIMWERMQALLIGINDIPASDNPYSIRLMPPQGAMYPHLIVDKLPPNVNVDDLSTNLAVSGIGLIPMTNFARTESSFHFATRAFRLTLGGDNDPSRLKKQTARLVAELTTSIQQIAYDYTLHSTAKHENAAFSVSHPGADLFLRECKTGFEMYWNKIESLARQRIDSIWLPWERKQQHWGSNKHDFLSIYLPTRKSVILSKLEDYARLTGNLRENFASIPFQKRILNRFCHEIEPSSESIRRDQFQTRLFDRTVHPTQVYALALEKSISEIIDAIINKNGDSLPSPSHLLRQLQLEYMGENIAIKSAEEAEEAIHDLDLISLVEDYSHYFYGADLNLILSLWGDWDGSQRPSGQGHTLVAATLIANVLRLSDLVRFMDELGILSASARHILNEIGAIEKKIQKFIEILDNITKLTTELEARIRKHLDALEPPGRMLRTLRKLGLARDPIQVVWKHNDRNERRMQAYRRERSTEILRFFKINYQLCGEIQRLIPHIEQHLHQPELLEKLATYKNPLKRFYLTPRIHQKIITSKDPFTIDTTVYNLVEINKMGAQFGHPGLVLSLQVSMTNRADAIIRLDKKLRDEWERVNRENPSIQPTHIRIVPLFEEIEILQNLEAFLDEIWNYAHESKRLEQSIPDRFCEIIGEFFIAGSDLSQQVSQTQALVLFKQAKACLNTYLLKKGLAGRIRIKFGSGESAQRQGGYFDPYAAKKALQLPDTHTIIDQLHVDGFTAAALQQARSPLNGIFSSSDFRTFQSNLVENLRQLPADALVNMFHHLRTTQATYESAIQNVTHTYWGSRRRLQEEMHTQLNLLMQGRLSPIYLEFAQLVQKNFKHILYGSAEDMAGIHAISLFLSRALLSVRDRPTVRPTKETGEDRGRQIVERLSGTLPLSEHGTLLRAIGHNKAQTMLLAINQLTTGLFRAMREFLGQAGNRDEQIFKLQKEILPHLPVRDILNTLRLYHAPDLPYLRMVESAFPPGNSSIKLLYEEQRVMGDLIPYLQEELLRRNGLAMLTRHRTQTSILAPEALRAIRADLAVLLQPNIFNTDIRELFGEHGISDGRLKGMRLELEKRKIIAATQSQIWQLIKEPITEQIYSFFELAQAIKALRIEGKIGHPRLNIVSRSQVSRLGSEVSRMLRNVADDSMRQFLISAVQYLLYLPETVEDIPEAVLIALRDVQKILSLDEQAVSRQDQSYLQYLFLKIARIGGDCG